MQNLANDHGKLKAFSAKSSFQMWVSPIALGISALDLHGLSDAERAIRCRRAADTLNSIASKLEAQS